MCIRDRINISPTETATLSVIGTSLGCTSTPLVAQIAVNPLPIISVNDATICAGPVSYTHLRAHETVLDLVCRLLLEKKKQKNTHTHKHTNKHKHNIVL